MILLNAFIFLLFPPIRLKNKILSIFGCNIHRTAKVGFSFILSKHIDIEENSFIGSFNFISVKGLKLKKKASILKLNYIKGPFYVYMNEKACIGNINKIRRAPDPISWGHSILRIGKNSKVTSRHLLDCTRPIIIGDNTVIGGEASQLWTHGYVHHPYNSDRARVDGSIRIGNNVYIGSASVIMPSVEIHNSINVGAHSTVPTSLKNSGLYVCQPLRFIPSSYEQVCNKYSKIKREKNPELILNKKHKR
ncbi:acyltransferase [Photorhabdus africana]|uniref:acyltransferase n=1 Tax=Photorhabdus africana TaxID=3097554 RepID=UPI002B400FBB|nr:DapH/DapD/GlmU-related protein [Photorhabdus sp. CRI-LC]